MAWALERNDIVILSVLVKDIGFFFSSRRRHTRFDCDWSSDVCSSDLEVEQVADHVTMIHQGGIVLSAPLDDIKESHRTRSEERRVGKECRSRWSPYH